MDEGTPAAVAEAPQQAQVEQQAPEAPVTPSAAPEAPVASKPDISTIAEDAELRKQLLDHPSLKKEIEHRAKSIREADVQLRVQQAIEAERQKTFVEAERQRIANMDDVELGEHTRQQWKQQEVQQQAMAQSMAQMGQMLLQTVQGLNLSDETKAELHPLNPKFKSFQDFFTAVVDAQSQQQARKLAQPEAKAMIADKVAELMAQQNGPVSLSPASGMPKRSYTTSEIDAMSLDQYRAVKDDIDLAAREGRIKVV